MSGRNGGAEPDRVYVGVFKRGADGRFTDVELLPDPDTDVDQVLTWDAETQQARWVDPAALGFTPVPMVLDVPVVDGAGFELTEGDGTLITCNVPSSEIGA